MQTTVRAYLRNPAYEFRCGVFVFILDALGVCLCVCMYVR